jgi:hypothetical protein
VTHDYGFRSKARWRGPAFRALIAGGLAAAAVTGWATWGSLKARWAAEAADAEAYGASGPPCPATTPERLKTEGPRLRETFMFEDMTLVRAFGQADCAVIHDKDGAFPICRLSSPGAVEVKSGTQDLLFAPGIGRPAAILRRNGKIACVMPGKDFVPSS